VLIKMVGGLDMEDFGELLADGNATSDPRALVGMIAVAVWRKNPRWDLQRVTRFVHQVDMDKLGFEGGDESSEEEEEPEPEADAGPPSQTKTGPESLITNDFGVNLTDANSSSPAVESKSPGVDAAARMDGSEEDSESGEQPPSPTGSPVSPITSAASALGS
jgi:hypothetical protein